MSKATVYRCDSCGATEADVARNWQKIELEKAQALSVSYYFGSNKTMHACSKECAARVLRQAADELCPPLVSGSATIHTGPYR